MHIAQRRYRRSTSASNGKSDTRNYGRAVGISVTVLRWKLHHRGVGAAA
jgi:hypothetical protein